MVAPRPQTRHVGPVQPPVQLICVCALLAAASANATLTNAVSASHVSTNHCPAFALKDQYDQSHSVAFPRAKPAVLTVADKKGSESIESWAHPLAVRFGERIDILGLADVSAVPRPLRGMVQGKFKKAIQHPVMLDWDGNLCRSFGYERNKANIYLIAPDGRIQLHLTGEADEAGLQRLGQAVEAELSRKP
jgi:hypothetical protein